MAKNMLNRFSSLAKYFYNKHSRTIQVQNASQRCYSTQMSVRTLAYPRALYGGRQTVSLLAGDGIGPEMSYFVKDVFKAAAIPVDFEDVNLDKYHCTKDDFDRALLSIRRNGVALKGSIESDYANPLFEKSRNAIMRVNLDLFANVMHVKTYEGVPARYPLDLVVIRQNTEGEYAMLEHETVPGVVECMKIITRQESQRLGHYAFQFARKNNRKKITCVHKANIQKLSDGLFLDTLTSVSQEYPDIEFNNMIVDNTCMQLAQNPHQFDVLVAPNLYGLITQNVISGLAGGAGLYSGRNYGDNCAVFEPGTRNTAAMLDSNVANPIAMLNASVDLLDYLCLEEHGALISDAIQKTLSHDKVHTRDLGGNASSFDVVSCIINHIKEAKM